MTAPFWTPTMDLQLRTAIADGRSAAMAADAIGCSRCAAIGRAWRLGLKFTCTKARAHEIRTAEALNAWGRARGA